MIEVSIFYPNSEGGKFDLDYYLTTHMPMSIRLLGEALRGVTVGLGISGGPPGSQPTYVVIARLLFDSPEAFYAAFMPHAEVLQGDIHNYTNVEPVIQISDVKIH
ncbi:MAG: EthD family reductase [Nitrospirae bacterium]|nr:EthD family reductase [Nitrospirota bacterium]